MKRILLVLALMVSVALLSGCSKFVLDARDLGEPVSMTKDVGSGGATENSTSFETTMKAAYCGWLFNLVNLKNADMSGLLDNEIQLAGGTAVKNVVIRKEKSFVDGLISIVSLGFYNQETITVQGEVVSK